MRPDILFPFFKDLKSLSGIGPKTAPLLQKLVGGDKVLDLLLHLPTHWIDRSVRPSFFDTIVGEIATVRGTVDSVFAGHGNGPTRVRLIDDTGFLTLVFFRAQPSWLQKQFPLNQEMIVSGLIEDFNNQRQMVHPDHVCNPAKGEKPPKVEPVYGLTAGVSSRMLQKAIAGALSELETLPEWINSELLLKRKWPSFNEALKQLHQPDILDEEAFALARERLAYDEALAREIAMMHVRIERLKVPSSPIPKQPHATNNLLDALKFSPTRAQLKAFNDIQADIGRKMPMRRMLQGDVGSGKTLVAALAVAQTAAAGKFTAFMSPTEVLARQQAEALEAFLAPIGYRCEALTGRDSKKRRNEVMEGVANGKIHCLSGTQSLYQTGVEFPDLGLVIIDEQHRFGVADRLKLTNKGIAPHLLMMSATPIPRTLASAINGDLDTSILDEKPAGRKPVTTRVASEERIEEVMAAVSRASERGERAFWVCPAVDAEGAEDSAATVRKAILDDVVKRPVALVHGKMPPAEKDAALDAFRKGDASVLVATTVVEVGVDVPEATIMVIERAEGFGLAQLHQLRGRVGRGDKPSSCLLLYKPPLTQSGQARLNVLRETDDGFAIAEADFKLRGPGDLLGLQQSGLPRFRVLDLTQHADLFAIAREDSRARLSKDAPPSSQQSAESTLLLTELFKTNIVTET
ncbi:ATP-dependent DNA helicase RecG [Hirschia litorea]|uniref:Probable DNA 3'-5' helicase RecG n=1 Tax=Hirschia litorea TaxID=1199156 RepID=A0ABW2IHX2_9PROT